MLNGEPGVGGLLKALGNNDVFSHPIRLSSTISQQG